MIVLILFLITLGGIRPDGAPTEKGVYLRVSGKEVKRVMVND